MLIYANYEYSNIQHVSNYMKLVVWKMCKLKFGKPV